MRPCSSVGCSGRETTLVLDELQGRRISVGTYAAIISGVALALTGVRLAFGYPLFHGLVEVFSIAIASGTFMVTWNLRRHFDSGYLLIIAIGFFFAAGIDTLYVFAYHGMNAFAGATENLSYQLWLIARFLQAGSLLIAPAFVRRKAPATLTYWTFAAISSVLLISLFVFDLFPAAFIEGTGQTPFKIYSELLVALAMLAGLAAAWMHRAAFPREVLWLLSGAIGALLTSEIAFAFDADPNSLWIVPGHLSKVLAYFLFYRAVAETVLVRPLDVLFGDLRLATDRLAESEERFRTTFEQATLGIAHIDLQGKWLRANSRLAEITGYTLDELLELRPEDITHPEDRPGERALIEQLLSGDLGEYSLEKRYIRKDGTLTWVEISRTLLRTAGGRPRYFIAIAEDISTRRAQADDLRRSRDLAERLNAIDLMINAATELEEIPRIAAEEGCRALGAESAAVLMRDASGWCPAHLYRFPHATIPVHAPSDRPIPIADADGSPLVVTDAYHDERMNPDTMRTFGIRSLLTVPLRFRGEDLGVIYFNYHSETRNFTAPEIEFIRRLSSSTTLALENARLAQAQQAIADTIESAILDMPVAIPGVEFAHAYRSATQLARIGGDFYDLFELDERTVAFMLGDVSGKGVEAATLTTMAKSTIRAYAYREHRPVAVLEWANSAICLQTDDSRFITAVYGTVDTVSGKLRVACAGHPQPFLCSDGRCRSHFMESSPPLGVMPELVISEFEVILDPDTLLVVFSDGLLEARAGDDFLGEDGVARTIETFSCGGPDEVVAALLEAAERHSGGRIEDDVALMALRFVGRSPRGN